MTKSDRTAILPGAALGVLGSGQLGRMFALAARAMGYRVHVFSPASCKGDTPTGQVADRETNADYEDVDAVAAFARDVSVVTFEFENVPSATTEAAARHAPVRPGGQVLHISQNRVREKTFLRDAGLPVTPFTPVRSLEELEALFSGSGAVVGSAQRTRDAARHPLNGERDAARHPLNGERDAARHPLNEERDAARHPLNEERDAARHPLNDERDAARHPLNDLSLNKGVLKTASWGYDGKGQVLINSADEVPAAWESLGGQEAILESFIEFDGEISVVAARGLDGAIQCFGPIANTHHQHILDVSVCPAAVPDKVAKASIDIARQVVEKLDVVGVLCVEFFVQSNGDVLINELAPRPHNSGHLTIDACVTSQFEQQVRTVCGLPLGSMEQVRPAAMANLLGDLWPIEGGRDEGRGVRGEGREVRSEHSAMPDFASALASPAIKLHLYGKHEPRIGRKMGHLTALAATTEQADALVTAARKALATDEHR